MNGVDLAEVMGQTVDERVTFQATQAVLVTQLPEDLARRRLDVLGQAEHAPLSDGDSPDLPGPVVKVAEDPAVDLAQVSQIIGRANRHLPEQDQGRVSDLPLRRLQFCGRPQPEPVAQDSRQRVGVRVAGHLGLPVAGDGPAVEFRRADLAVHVGRDLTVMLGAERARHLDLHRLGR
jgi:hypothetical protein